jgi:hypothetical protein
LILKGFFFGGRLSAMSATLRRTGTDSASLQLSPLAWLGAGAALYLLISIQMRYHERAEGWQRLMGSLQMLLRIFSLLGARDDPLLAGSAPCARAPDRSTAACTRRWKAMRCGCSTGQAVTSPIRLTATTS